ncbi:MAG: hypothetical protein AABX82_06770 [Nanoarchaeota archaeon]
MALLEDLESTFIEEYESALLKTKFRGSNKASQKYNTGDYQQK